MIEIAINMGRKINQNMTRKIIHRLGLSYIISPPAGANSIEERGKVKYEGNNYLQKNHHNWTRTNQLVKHLALNRTKKQTQRSSGSCKHCALSGCHK